MTANKSCIVLGVGPKTGASVAKRFADAGYSVAIGARNIESLAPVVESISKAGNIVLPITTDATDEVAVSQFVNKAESELGPIAVAVYNTSGFTRKSVLQLTGAEMEDAWRRTCLGGFYLGRDAALKMLTRNEGTIIFTGATAGLRGSKNFAGFAIGKFGLRALAQSMARELQPQGIHVVWVNIDGQINNPTDIEATTTQPADSMLNPDAIAEVYHQLHCQNRSAWTQEIDLRPWVETF